MRLLYVTTAAIALGLAGCSPKSPETVAKGVDAPPAESPAKAPNPPIDTGDKGKGAPPKGANPQPGQPTMKPPIGAVNPPGAHTAMRSVDWQPATASAMEVARGLDERIATLANVRLDSRYGMLLPDTITNGSAQSKIQGPTRYAIEYPYVRDGIPRKAIVRADGTRRGELREGKSVEPGAPQPTGEKLGWQIKPVATVERAPTGEKAVSNWALGFQRAILAPIIDRSTPFSSLIAALESGAGGYAVTVEERERLVRGQIVHNYRIVAERKGASAKKLGESRIEIVSDAHLRLPVTIRVNEQKPGDKGPTRIAWTGAWIANQAFDAAEFKLPR